MKFQQHYSVFMAQFTSYSFHHDDTTLSGAVGILPVPITGVNRHPDEYESLQAGRQTSICHTAGK